MAASKGSFKGALFYELLFLCYIIVMSGFEDLRPRAEAIVRGVQPEAAPPIPDSLIRRSSAETLSNLNSLAFKIALGLKIIGTEPDITIQQILAPEGQSKAAAVPTQTNAGWVVDFSYRRYEYEYVLEEFSPIGTFLDEGGGLYYFNGVRRIDKEDPIPDPILIDPDRKIEGAFRQYTHSDMERADELMTSLAVFAVREGVDIS
jgi:hypothetical protein